MSANVQYIKLVLRARLNLLV